MRRLMPWFRIRPGSDPLSSLMHCMMDLCPECLVRCTRTSDAEVASLTVLRNRTAQARQQTTWFLMVKGSIGSESGQT